MVMYVLSGSELIHKRSGWVTHATEHTLHVFSWLLIDCKQPTTLEALHKQSCMYVLVCYTEYTHPGHVNAKIFLLVFSILIRLHLRIPYPNHAIL